MADNLNLDTSNGTALEPAFQDYIDNTHTADHLLTDPAYDPNNKKVMSVGQILLSAANKAGDTKNGYFYKADTGGYGNYGFDRQATVGNFEQGREKVGLEGTQHPSRTRALQSENPQEVYAHWYSMMRNFAYGGR